MLSTVLVLAALILGFVAGRVWGKHTEREAWHEAVLQNHRAKKAEAKMTAKQFGESSGSWLGGK